MTTPRVRSRYLKREGNVEATTSLEFQLHQRGRSFLVSFKARDKIYIFMMLQPTMKGEKSSWGERKQIWKAVYWQNQAVSMQVGCNFSLLPLLDLEVLLFSVFFGLFFFSSKNSSNALSWVFPFTIKQITVKLHILTQNSSKSTFP